MEIFFTLLLKLLPLYALIAVGFWVQRALRIDRETIGNFLIYVITPAVVFYGVSTTPMSWNVLLLPLLFLALCVFTCLVFYRLGAWFWSDSTKNILAFTAGTGNTGYFGLPVAIALFGEEAIGISVICSLGFILYENSLGFYITARGNFSAQAAFRKVLKLPSLHAYVLGVLFSLFQIEMNASVDAVFRQFTGAYSVFGMMLIGMALSGMTKAAFDFRFLSLCFLARFLVWPVLVVGVIFLDLEFLNLFTPMIHQVMVLMAVAPLAALTVAFSVALKTQPEKAAFAVIASTIFALFYIPLAVILMESVYF